MNVTRLAVTPFEIPFREPVLTSRGEITERRGFLVAVFSESGAVGIGEIAPLPEFGTETHSAAERRLAPLAARTEWPACEYGIEEISVWRQKLWLSPVSHPATCFGIECAMLALLCQSEPAPVQEQLSDHAADRLRINALVSGARPADVIAAANHAISEGFRALKIKVGTRVIEEDIQLFRRLHELFPNAWLRADANGGWSIEETLKFAEATKELPLEYVEDPVPVERLDDLWRDPQGLGMRLALDEAVRSPEILRRMLAHCRCTAVIVKPPVLGSFMQLVEAAVAVRDQTSQTVITSLYESSVGLSYAAVCAGAYGSFKFAHGLGTARLLAEDTLTEPLLPMNGYLMVPEVRDLPGRLLPRYKLELGIPA
jgi:O-succinylbenzoate synthase